MTPSIQMLELAVGIKDLLLSSGFTTIDSLVQLSPSEIASILGIEFYVAKIIKEAAKRAAVLQSTTTAGESLVVVESNNGLKQDADSRPMMMLQAD